ncbi:LysR family transcriptional regulator [Xanthobacter sp. V3C-3]|uniref:LysR family transcriptional regulator n=1 Tax=Xanthobacter lutulentifluminis TaxID=3119935 RepID=UPI00372B70BE
MTFPTTWSPAFRKLPPLNAIRSIEAAARHSSFTAAADELHVTVAAVSHQVRHLEAMLDVKLFDRSGRSVSLTRTGRTLFPTLRDDLDRLADAFSTLREERSGEAITVSTTRAFAERRLMPRLGRFNAMFPDIVVHVDATEDVANLRAGAIDVAIRYGPADPTHEPAILLRARPVLDLGRRQHCADQLGARRARHPSWAETGRDHRGHHRR